MLNQDNQAYSDALKRLDELEQLPTHPKDTGLLKKSWVLPKSYLLTHTGRVWQVYLNNTATVGQQAALKNIKELHLENRITLIFNDALNVKIDDSFDLIFIDAAKSQNIKFFELFERNLKDNGYIITDNMYFHGLVNKNEKEIVSRNVRGIVRKIKDYISFLKDNDKYDTTIYDVGDGVSVSYKK